MDDGGGKFSGFSVQKDGERELAGVARYTKRESSNVLDNDFLLTQRERDGQKEREGDWERNREPVLCYGKHQWE